MRRSLVLPLLLVLLGGLSGCSLHTSLPEQVLVLDSPCEYATLTKIYDGDTIAVTLADGQEATVRLIGIDAPERDTPYTTAEPYGDQAKAWAQQQMTLGETLCLERDPLSDSEDRYGRWLRYAALSDGRDLSLLMLQAGYAEYMRAFPYTRKPQYRAAEQQAKKSQAGAWDFL